MVMVALETDPSTVTTKPIAAELTGAIRFGPEEIIARPSMLPVAPEPLSGTRLVSV